jgi:hypothetical protein
MRHESSEDLVKYGVRHYAHLSCALTKWGEPFLDRLHVHQLGQLSWMVLSQHNMLFAVKRRIDAHAEKSVPATP